MKREEIRASLRRLLRVRCFVDRPWSKVGGQFAGPAGFDAPAFFKDVFSISQADKPWKGRVATELSYKKLGLKDESGKQTRLF